jgi:hypothetical protein
MFIAYTLKGRCIRGTYTLLQFWQRSSQTSEIVHSLRFLARPYGGYRKRYRVLCAFSMYEKVVVAFEGRRLFAGRPPTPTRKKSHGHSWIP